ncbi:MAG: hypothetical protein IPN68_06025 [Bacteroidetes bacterium]|nr:hypothetical protein [Bacteroidota bacterium]
MVHRQCSDCKYRDRYRAASVYIETGNTSSDVTIGSGGDPINSIVYATIASGSFAVPRGNNVKTYAVSGARVGGNVIVNPVGAISGGIFMNYARVSAVDEVEIGWNATPNTSPTLTNVNLNIMVINHP